MGAGAREELGIGAMERDDLIYGGRKVDLVRMEDDRGSIVRRG